MHPTDVPVLTCLQIAPLADRLVEIPVFLRPLSPRKDITFSTGDFLFCLGWTHFDTVPAYAGI